jgi:shikimate kinase
MTIFLIGYKGSGKTTVGKALSGRLNMEFIDLDDYLDKIEGKSVKQIFLEDGEEIYRLKEHNALIKLLDNVNNVVISTGGGVPCFYDNIFLMNDNGITIYLRAHTNILFERQKRQINRSPILKCKDEGELKDFIHEKRKRCECDYLKSKYIVDVDNLSVEEIVKSILKLLGFSKPNRF